MIDIKKAVSIIAAKAISFILRKTGSGATAAPGLMALKIDPKLLLKLKSQLKFSIIISGTNGKTTTSRMLASILKTAGIPFYHNRTGSNLLRGVASELINYSNIVGSFPRKTGLWEIDEAVFPHAAEQLKPKIVVLTNLFRDQLDRYGEINTLAKKWQKALEKLSPKTIVILNADDPTVASLGKNLTCQVIYFGIKDKSLGTLSLSHASDATLCPDCFLPLNYQACFVSHLGIYKCSKCGAIQPETNIDCLQAKFLKDSSIQAKIKAGTKEYSVKINLPGLYNIYNALASFSAASSLKIVPQKIIQGFKNFQPAFGRFEKIKIPSRGRSVSDRGNKSLKILLVKNPAGFNEVLKTLIQLTKEQKSSCLIVLNDLIADGRDVSWIWDVDFKLLKKVNIEKLIISGSRTYDMALRAKHAKISCHSGASAIESQKRSYRPSDSRMTEKNSLHDNKDTKFVIESNLKKAINLLLKSRSKNLFILPTYTAMLETRKILYKLGLVHSTWKD